jgi:hypothetical protein
MLDEIEEMLDFLYQKNVIFFSGLHRFLQCEAGAKNDPVGLLQSPDGLF